MPALIIRTIEVIGQHPGRLDFERGVNVLVAPKDKGKTTVFRCINSVLGGKVDADTFRNEMAQNDWVRGVIAVNSDIYTVYRGVRRLHDYVYIAPGDITVEDPTTLSKLMVAVTQGTDISYLEFLLNALGLPQFQYLKSLELSSQDKDQFTFRSILRQMYVRSDGYGGLVYKELPHHRKMGFLMATGTLDIDRAIGSVKYKETYQRFSRLTADRSRIWTLVEHVATMFGVDITGLDWGEAAETIIAILSQGLADAEERVADLFRGAAVSEGTVGTLEPQRLVKLKARLDALLQHHSEVEIDTKRLQQLRDHLMVRIDNKKRYAAGAAVFANTAFIEHCTYCGQSLDQHKATHPAQTKIDVLKSVSADKEELAITAQLLVAKTGLLQDITDEIGRASVEYRQVSQIFDASLYSSAYSDAVGELLERRASLRRAIQDMSQYQDALSRINRDVDDCEQFLAGYPSWDADTKTASALRWDDIIQPKQEAKKNLMLDMDALLNDFYSGMVDGFVNARLSEQFTPSFRQEGSSLERLTGGSSTDALVILGYFYALFKYALQKGDVVPFPKLLLIDGLYGTWPLVLREAIAVVKKFTEVASFAATSTYQLILSFRQDDETDARSHLLSLAGREFHVLDLSDRGFLTISDS